jgi:hypothetical protein
MAGLAPAILIPGHRARWFPASWRTGISQPCQRKMIQFLIDTILHNRIFRSF